MTLLREGNKVLSDSLKFTGLTTTYREKRDNENHGSRSNPESQFYLIEKFGGTTIMWRKVYRRPLRPRRMLWRDLNGFQGNIDENLTISGSRDDEVLVEGSEYIRRERRSGKFSRTIELPFQIDVDAIQTQFQNGVLRVELPHIPEGKPRKIKVK